MKLTKKAKKNLFIIFVTCLLVVSILLCVIIYQTVKINALKNEITGTNNETLELQEEIKKQNKEVEYFESEDFKEDYKKYELVEFKEGELVYK